MSCNWLAAGALHPRVPPGVRQRMVRFLGELRATSSTGALGPAGSSLNPKEDLVHLSGAGGPWEFNLRDLLRWCELAGGAAARACPGCGPGAACAGLLFACDVD